MKAKTPAVNDQQAAEKTKLEQQILDISQRKLSKLVAAEIPGEESQIN